MPSVRGGPVKVPFPLRGAEGSHSGRPLLNRSENGFLWPLIQLTGSRVVEVSRTWAAVDAASRAIPIHEGLLGGLRGWRCHVDVFLFHDRSHSAVQKAVGGGEC